MEFNYSKNLKPELIEIEKKIREQIKETNNDITYEVLCQELANYFKNETFIKNEIVEIADEFDQENLQTDAIDESEQTSLVDELDYQMDDNSDDDIL
ncbi:hypothetical protein A0H76_2100 [Hepatospora eriocheir]|uniref:Uncharacterized protein n=1 Tax=Hepatospora eriocheir TaxID=1081669 RepID=A0A1X0QD11_9MICR|nr:hypothetical protein HERIO_451 [Hepatospora eriocheir]ORD98665.1 hypothetical protein A0H76_2100 [Hepatospora eriocheir]